MSAHDNDHDVIDVLTTDHREPTELIGQILNGPAAERRDLTDCATS